MFTNISNRLKTNNIRFSFILYLFCFIFAPPIIPEINFLLLVGIYSLFMLWKKYKKEVKDILYYSGSGAFTKYFLFFLLYLLIITIFNVAFDNIVILNEYFIVWYRFFLIVPITAVCIIYIIARCKELKYSFDNLILCIILAGLLQVAIAILAFLIPQVKNFLMQIMYMSTGNTIFEVQYHVERRFFGFANDMLDSFGYGTGIIASLPIFLAFYKRKPLYFLLAPILAIVPFLNARTGIIILALSLLFSIPLLIDMKKSDRKKFSKVFLFIFLLIILLIGIIFLVSPKIMQSTFNDIGSIFEFLFTGQKGPERSNTASVLFSKRFWTLPPFPEIIFGTGHTIFSVKGFAHSDVGYINDLWLCGILGVMILYGVFIKLFYSAIKIEKSKVNKCLVLFLALSLATFQIKGRAIMANTGIICTLTICFYLIYTCSKSNIDNNFVDIDKVKRLEYLNDENNNCIISIVVPIYKVEKYLEKCIDSIINQDYKNLEIILVDDGSPDRCPQICDEYAQKDSRIKVIHKENGGLSDARNAGIKVATGEYIAFIDSDDYITENYISTLMYTIKKYDADISACNYIKLYEDSGIEKVEPKINEDLVMTNIEAMKDLFTLPNNSDVVTWNKLYKTSLFTQNNIEFPKGKLHEDNFTTYKLYYYSNKVVFTNVPCYYYLQRKDSIMGKKFNIKRLDILLALKETEEFVKENNIDLNQEVKFNELLRLLTVLNSMVDTKCIDKKVFEDIRTMIKKDKEVYLKNPYLGVKHKVAVKSLISSRKLYIIIRKLFVFKNKYI